MLIAQMTDIHIGFAPDERPEELNSVRFRATLARILDGPNRPDLMVVSGDLTDHGDIESFEKTAALLGDVGVARFVQFFFAFALGCSSDGATTPDADAGAADRAATDPLCSRRIVFRSAQRGTRIEILPVTLDVMSIVASTPRSTRKVTPSPA